MTSGDRRTGGLPGCLAARRAGGGNDTQQNRRSNQSESNGAHPFSFFTRTTRGRVWGVLCVDRIAAQCGVHVQHVLRHDDPESNSADLQRHGFLYTREDRDSDLLEDDGRHLRTAWRKRAGSEVAGTTRMLAARHKGQPVRSDGSGERFRPLSKSVKVSEPLADVSSNW